MENIEEIISRIESHEKNQIKNVLLKYLKKWPWFVLFCTIGIGLGYFKYKNSPDQYTVASRILIKGEEKSMSSVLNFDRGSFFGMGNKSNIENQIGILQSYTLFRRAITKLNWKTSWYHKKLMYNHELYNNPPFELIVPPNAMNLQNLLIEIVPLNDQVYNIKIEGKAYMNGREQSIQIEQKGKFGNPFINEFFNFTLNKNIYGIPGETYYLNFNSLHALTSQYLARTNIELEGLNSDLIVVSLNGENPQKEADFINELNNVFIEFGMENETKNTESSVEFIDSQLERIKGSLSTAEEKFSKYRQNNQVMNLGSEAQSVYQKLQEIEEQQYLTQLQVDYYKDLKQYLDDSNKIEEMVNPTIVGITDQNLNDLIKKLMDLYGKREILAYSVQEKNPKLIVLEKDIKITRDALEETIKNMLNATELKITSLNERYNTIQSRLTSLPETEKQLVSLQREFDLQNEMYTYMLQKRAEASISKASIAPKVQVIDPALIEASYRTGPKLVINVGVGFIGGFMILFFFITLINFFVTKIENREEIEKESEIPVLEGIIKHKYKVKLPVIHYPRSGISESFRGLKSNINAMLERPGSKVVSVNSLIPGEGKSFISSNYSAILTKSNSKVLIIGADLHKPTLHHYLGIEETYGLSNYLAGEKGFDEIINSTHIPNLSIIQSGPIPDNPSDLIDNKKFEFLVDNCRKMFDYVIIDNAPLLLVPDAILTSQFSDASLFILRMNYSHKEQIKQINKMVSFNKIKNASILINEAPDRGYGYGNKYWKKGYGEYKGKMSIA